MAKRLVRVLVHRLTGYDVVRVAAGALLLLAAGLKTYLPREPMLGTGFLDSPWLLFCVVEFVELPLGLCLLANLWPRPTWAAALACFGLFACVSLYKALAGYATCGCFGRLPVTVSPWFTAALDLVIVFSLLCWRPRGRELLFATELRQPARRAVAVLAIWLAVGIAAALAMRSYEPAVLPDAGTVSGGGKIVVLEPRRWVGKRFPLLDYIDIGNSLAEGKWLVVLYRYNCPKCQVALARYERLSFELVRNGEAVQLALIEAPPYDGRELGDAFQEERPVHGRLSEKKRWFIRTPVQLRLENGLVRRVISDGA